MCGEGVGCVCVCVYVCVCVCVCGVCGRVPYVHGYRCVGGWEGGREGEREGERKVYATEVSKNLLTSHRD